MDGEIALDSQPPQQKKVVGDISLLTNEGLGKPARRFSSEAKASLLAQGCKILEIGDSGLTANDKLDKLRHMSAGLISDAEIEKLLFSWPENTEYALLPEVTLGQSGDKDYEATTALMSEYSSQFEDKTPDVSIKNGSVAEYVGIMHFLETAKKNNPFANVYASTDSIIEDRNGNSRKCVLIQGVIDIADVAYKDPNFKVVPLISPTA